MPSPRAPSMPTQKQIHDALKVVRELCPGARIKGIGPEGVIFDYPENQGAADDWHGKPFSGGS